MPTLSRVLIALIAWGLLTTSALSQDAELQRLDTDEQGRGWEAVGRIDFGAHGFCTGALISPTEVLTAAHCLFDPDTGEAIPEDQIEFLAGWRNGRASAYRRVRRAVAHPEYRVKANPDLAKFSRDVALLELYHPVRNTTVIPFETDMAPRPGDRIAVVSYAEDRADAPSLQEICAVRAHQQGTVVMTCDVNYGSSGAPVFSLVNQVPRIVSVISAKASVRGEKVALGTSLENPLILLRNILHGNGETTDARTLSSSGGAKFIKP